MDTRSFTRSLFTLATALVAAFMLGAASAWAQTAPTAGLTFDNGDAADNYWKTPGNWDTGLIPTSTDDAWIGSSQTAYHNQGTDGDPVFGTLTLGTNATLQFRANNNQGIPTGSNVYFSDGSTLEYTAGSSNRDPNFIILPGASAKWKTAGGTFFRGTLQGDGDLTVVMKGTVESRVQALNHTGHLTYESNNGSPRNVSRLGRYGGTTSVGSGGATFAENVSLTQEKGNRMHDSATLKLVGGSGNANPKYRLGNNSETIANLVFESPTGSAPLLLTGSSSNPGALTVTDTVTFQGTAGTVEIRNENGAYYQGNPRADSDDIRAGHLLFQGTGAWTVVGTRANPDFAFGTVAVIGGGDITTDADATITAGFKAPAGFEKLGNGRLTLTDDFALSSGQVDVSEGTLKLDGATVVGNVLVAAVGTLTGDFTISGDTTISGTHSPGSSPGINTFEGSLTYGSGGAEPTVEWELIDNTVAGRGTNYDGINVTVGEGTGNLTFAEPTTLTLIFDLNGAVESVVDWNDEFWQTSHLGTDGWLLWDVAGTTTGLDNVTLASNYLDGSDSLAPIVPVFSLYLDEATQNVYLQVVGIIPEPSTMILVGLGLVGLTLRRRR